MYQKIPSNDTQLYKKVKRSCYFDKTLMIKEIIMNVYIGLIIIIAFLLICFMGIKVIKNKKVVDHTGWYYGDCFHKDFQ